MRRTWRAAAIGAWACGLTGCYIPGSGWTLRSGLDVRNQSQTRRVRRDGRHTLDEWNRVAQCNVYGGGVQGVWSDGGPGYPATPTTPASPAWSEQPAYPLQQAVRLPRSPFRPADSSRFRSATASLGRRGSVHSAARRLRSRHCRSSRPRVAPPESYLCRLPIRNPRNLPRDRSRVDAFRERRS